MGRIRLTKLYLVTIWHDLHFTVNRIAGEPHVESIFFELYYIYIYIYMSSHYIFFHGQPPTTQMPSFTVMAVKFLTLWK